MSEILPFLDVVRNKFASNWNLIQLSPSPGEFMEDFQKFIELKWLCNYYFCFIYKEGIGIVPDTPRRSFGSDNFMVVRLWFYDIIL